MYHFARNWGDANMMDVMSLVCAFAAGVIIVLSRSINAYLAKHIGALPSSFFNYLTGFLTSIVCFVLLSFPSIYEFTKVAHLPNYWMLMGGVIGVFNIVILNIVVHKIAPLALTLCIFIAQLVSGMLLDILLFDVFSIQKLIGCMIVLFGLLHYQYVVRKTNTPTQIHE